MIFFTFIGINGELVCHFIVRVKIIKFEILDYIAVAIIIIAVSWSSCCRSGGFIHFLVLIITVILHFVITIIFLIIRHRLLPLLSTIFLQFELFFVIERVIPRVIITKDLVPIPQHLLLHSDLLVVLLQVGDVAVVVHLFLLANPLHLLQVPCLFPTSVEGQQRSAIAFEFGLPCSYAVFISHAEFYIPPSRLHHLLIGGDLVENLLDLLCVVGHLALLVKLLHLEDGRSHQLGEANLFAIVGQVAEHAVVDGRHGRVLHAGLEQL